MLSRSLSILFFFLLLNINQAFSQTPPITNGLFYGDGDHERYALLYNDVGRGKMYYYVDANKMYLAFVLDPSLNDNVVGDGSMTGYMESVDWLTDHNFGKLEGSDRLIEISFACGGTTSYIWDQDYLWGGDGNDPNLLDWLPNGINNVGDNGGNTPPPGYIVASSMAWNMNNTNWDVQQGDPSAGSGAWRSPSKDENGLDVFPAALDFPYFNEYHQWEWAMVYEMSFDIATCGNNPISVGVVAMHNSPRKSGSDDAVVDPPVCTISGTTNVTQPTCNNAIGSININITNGTAPYNYTWSSNNTSGSGTGTFIDNLIGGQYYVVITDANNCKYARTIQLTEVITPVIAINATDPSSCGGADGSLGLKVTRSDSVSILQRNVTSIYKIAGSNEDAIEKADGTVSINKNEVKFKLDGSNDWNGLRFSNINLPVGSIIENAVIEFTSRDNQSGTMQVRFYGQANTTNPLPFSTADFNISGRTPATNFVDWVIPAWSGNNSYNSPDIRAIIEENLDAQAGVSNAALVFTIETRSGSGERKAYTYDDKPENAPRLALTYSYIDTVSNPTPPNYTYQWSGGTGTGMFGAETLINNLSTGTYGLTISGDGICTTEAQASLNGSLAFSIVNTTTTEVCTNLGQIQIELDGGQAPFTYNWAAGSNIGSGNGLTIINLLADNYNLTVTDDTGCTATTNGISINYEAGCSCSISGTISNVVYDDKNTPDNVSDDVFFLDLSVNGVGSNDGWEGGGKSGQYGQTITYGPYPVDAAGANFVVKDQNIPNCFFSVSANYSSCAYLKTCTCCATNEE